MQNSLIIFIKDDIILLGGYKVYKVEDNICVVVPKNYNYSSIHIINLVYEVNASKIMYDWTLFDYYRVSIVVEGSATLNTKVGNYSLNKGDIFFFCPNNFYKFSNLQNFKYSYVSFLGARSDLIMSQLNINRQNCVFNNCNKLIDFFQSAIKLESEFPELKGESVLLYTLAYLGKKRGEEQQVDKDNIAYVVKKFVEENFANPSLSLELIASYTSYNKKYLSSLFKKTFNMGINDYLLNIRIKNACILMEKGVDLIKKVAYLCGFNNPLYFSKVFRKKMGKTPKEYIQSLN